MKKTISLGNFRDEFRNHGRANQFSYEGLEVLYDYLTEMEESCGVEEELDVVGISCEFTEYENFEELQVDHNVESMEELRKNTLILMVDDESFIILAY